MLELLEQCESLPQHNLAVGDTLISEGEPSTALWVLAEGTLEVRKGDLRVAVISDPGACVGEVGLLVGIPATATVVAVTPVRVHVAADGAGFLRERPEVAVLVARVLADRLYLVTTFLTDLQRQYGGTGGSLAVVDSVLSALLERSGPTSEPGSAREPDPRY